MIRPVDDGEAAGFWCVIHQPEAGSASTMILTVYQTRDAAMSLETVTMVAQAGLSRLENT
jgi:hypothetical protein